MNKNTGLAKIDTQLRLQASLKYNALNKIENELTYKKLTALFEPDKIKRYSDFFTLLVGNVLSDYNSGEIRTVLDFRDKEFMEEIYEKVKILIGNLYNFKCSKWNQLPEDIDLPLGFFSEKDFLDASVNEDLKKIYRNFNLFIQYHRLTFMKPGHTEGSITDKKDAHFEGNENIYKAYDSLNAGMKFLLNILVKCKPGTGDVPFIACKDEYGLPILADAQQVLNEIQLYFKGIKDENDFRVRYSLRSNRYILKISYLWFETVPELNQITKILHLISGSVKIKFFKEFLEMVNAK